MQGWLLNHTRICSWNQPVLIRENVLAQDSNQKPESVHTYYKQHLLTTGLIYIFVKSLFLFGIFKLSERTEPFTLFLSIFDTEKHQLHIDLLVKYKTYKSSN